MVEIEHQRMPEAFERARVNRRTLALWYLGGAGYALRSPKACILIDPFTGPSPAPEWVRRLPPALNPEDIRSLHAVLLTHEHVDHTDVRTLLPICQHTSAPIFGPPSSIRALESIDAACGRGQIMRWGESAQIEDLLITAVEVYDPSAESCNGYVIEGQGVTVLHCGDSLYFAGFATLGRRWTLDALCLSVGINPPGKTYYMDEADAARAARDSGTRMLVPQHFDLWEATALDPRRIVKVASWYCPQVHVRPARFCRRLTIHAAGSSD